MRQSWDARGRKRAEGGDASYLYMCDEGGGGSSGWREESSNNARNHLGVSNMGAHARICQWNSGSREQGESGGHQPWHRAHAESARRGAESAASCCAESASLAAVSAKHSAGSAASCCAESATAVLSQRAAVLSQQASIPQGQMLGNIKWACAVVFVCGMLRVHGGSIECSCRVCVRMIRRWRFRHVIGMGES